jgi:hypothetical protein
MSPIRNAVVQTREVLSATEKSVRTAVTFAIAVTLSLTSARAAKAQAPQWFPETHPFRSPLADPFEPRFSGSLIITDLFSRRGNPPERPPFFLEGDHDPRHELQAPVTFGKTVPFVLWHSGRESVMTVGIQASVNGRFRIERPSRDALGEDWMVAFPIEIGWRQWSGRARLLHRSSHLGDEFIQTNGGERIEFGGDGIDFAAAYQLLPALRLYGAANWIFHSNTEQETVIATIGRRDRILTQFGADFLDYAFAGGRLGYVAAVDAQLAERSDWRTSISAQAGLAARRGTRSGRLVVRFHGGPSPMGEFFLTTEDFWGLELVFDW